MSLKRKTQEYVLTEVKIDAVKPDIAIVKNGSYNGNNTANRAIPHGLGEKPEDVTLITTGGVSLGRIFTIINDDIYHLDDGSKGVKTVTAMDATNFYVGNASGYSASANEGTQIIYWKAFV